MKRRSKFPILVGVLVLASACGLNDTGRQELTQFGGSGGGTGGVGLSGGSGDSAGGEFGGEGLVSEDGVALDESGVPIPGGNTSGGGTNTGGNNSGGGNNVVKPPAGKGTTTGVTDTEIRIGIHAPVTGAAPFPAAAFEKGKDLYWDWSGAPKIFGRKVKIFFEDDTYNPTTAVDRCRKMAEQDKVFLLVGGGGTDQIQACARYAAQKGIPYLSAGVTEIGLRGLSSYFAASMSYAQQGPLLWQRIKKGDMGSTDSVAMVYTNSPNFQDARDAFVNAMSKDGKKLILERKMSKNPSSSEYQQTAAALQASGAAIVYILVAPVHYIQLSARTGAYRPWWVGVGVTKGINEVLGTGCNTSGNGIEKGRFLSPFPGVDVIDSLDPNYNKAYQEKNGSKGDDLGIALWGLNKGLHRMFEKTGKDLTREGFIATVQQGSFETGVFPTVSYTPQNHFGSKGAHLLKANCSTRQYETEAQFATGF